MRLSILVMLVQIWSGGVIVNSVNFTPSSSSTRNDIFTVYCGEKFGLAVKNKFDSDGNLYVFNIKELDSDGCIIDDMVVAYTPQGSKMFKDFFHPFFHARVNNNYDFIKTELFLRRIVDKKTYSYGPSLNRMIDLFDLINPGDCFDENLSEQSIRNRICFIDFLSTHCALIFEYYSCMTLGNPAYTLHSDRTLQCAKLQAFVMSRDCLVKQLRDVDTFSSTPCCAIS